MQGVSVQQLAEKMKFKCFTPCVDMSKRMITTPEINRPALQLTGYLEHFANERVQIIGYVEYTYLMQLSDEERTFKYERFISSKIPCVIFSTMTRPSQDMIDLAIKYNVPTFVTERTTSSFMAEIIRWLGVQLAPCISIHGVLVDVYGEGVLITGESGIGKSEAALELIKRGHRLVSDDVVELRKVSDVTLVGSAPDITRHFIELRGIGIIDVKTLFGVESVKDTQSVDLVIKLEEWDRDKEYDRLGLPRPDLTLYLDTHPEDQDALKLFHQTLKQKKEAERTASFFVQFICNIFVHLYYSFITVRTGQVCQNLPPDSVQSL